MSKLFAWNGWQFDIGYTWIYRISENVSINPVGKGFYLLSSFCLSVKIGDCYDSIHLKPTFDTEKHRTCAEVLEAVDHWRAHGLEVQLGASYVELFGSEALHWCWLHLAARVLAHCCFFVSKLNSTLDEMASYVPFGWLVATSKHNIDRCT